MPTIGHLDFDTPILAYGEKVIRYEMYDGDVFAMAGGSRNHGEISLNAAVALRVRAKPRGCTTYGPDG